MFVQTEGAGTPVLLIHAGASSSAQWTGYARALGPGVRTFAPDLHGHGNTPLPLQVARDSAIDDFVDDLLHVMHGEDRFHIVGHSFGGLMAIAVALRAPQRVLSLTAVEPACFDAARIAGPPELYAEYAREIDLLASLVARGEHETAMQIVLARWGMARWELLSPAQRLALADLAPALLGVGLTAALHWRHDPDQLATLAAVPTLLVHGDQSPAIVLPVCEALRAAIPNARRICIEGAGHMLPITHRSTLKTLLRHHFDAAIATEPHARPGSQS